MKDRNKNRSDGMKREKKKLTASGRPKERKGYWKLNEEDLGRTVLQTYFGKAYGPL